MIKKLAWDTFKKTGNINTYMEYKQFEHTENDIKQIADIQKITKQSASEGK